MKTIRKHNSEYDLDIDIKIKKDSENIIKVWAIIEDSRTPTYTYDIHSVFDIVSCLYDFQSEVEYHLEEY